MKKRIISLILVLSVMLAFLPVLTATSSADEDWRAWSQKDSRWADLPLGSSGGTVGGYGCTVTSVTKLIIQCGLRDASDFNVATLVNWLNNNGGFTSGGALRWAKPSQCVSGFKNYGELIDAGTYSSAEYNDKIISWIKKGYHMVVAVKNQGHWVAVDEAKSLATRLSLQS